MQDNLQYSMNKAACEGLLFFFSGRMLSKIFEQAIFLTHHSHNEQTAQGSHKIFFEHAGIHAVGLITRWVAPKIIPSSVTL